MAYHPITQCPYICNIDLLWHPDHKSRPVTLDYTGTDGVIKAGTPISAAGAVANNGNAVGILLRDCYDGFHAAGNVVIDGFIRQDVAEEHSGVQLTDDAKRAMSKLVFVDAEGVPDPPAGGAGGGTDDVYLIKQIINSGTQTIELQGDYAGAVAAYLSGKSLKFVSVIIMGGNEVILYESFSYCCNEADSEIRFVCYSGTNFMTVTLTESGITMGNDTHVNSLYVDIPDNLFLKSTGTNKLFCVMVSDTGELSTAEVK